MADDPETTVLAGPTPSVEEIVMAAGTISFFGGRRLVKMPLIRPSAYSDKDLQDICDTLADAENAVFLLTSVLEDKFGKIRPGKREQKLISACEKLGYCAQVTKPGRTELQKMLQGWAEEMGTRFAPGADTQLLDRCGEDQFLLRNEVDKLAALSGYDTVTRIWSVPLARSRWMPTRWIWSDRWRQGRQAKPCRNSRFCWNCRMIRS